MRRPTIRVWLSAGALALAVNAVMAQPPAMPARRAGAWEIKISGLSGQGGTMTLSTCVNPGSETSFSPGAMGPRGPGGAAAQRCVKEDHHPIPGGWAFSSVCPSRQGGMTTASGTVTGDFRTHLHIETDLKDARGSQHMVMDQRWLGASCQASGGQTMTLPNGRVITIPPH